VEGEDFGGKRDRQMDDYDMMMMLVMKKLVDQEIVWWMMH
jgi:hypothetical protein